MEFYELFGVVGILQESIEILPRNGKLMAIVTLFYLVLSSTFLYVFNFSVKSILPDMLLKESFPVPSSINASEYITLLASIQQTMGIFLTIYVIFLVSYLLISFFSSIAVVSISASSYINKSLSITELLIRVLKSWTRPLVTMFYTMLLEIGYCSFFLFMISPLLVHYNSSNLYFAILIAVAAYIIFLYLSVVWVVSIVISVVEDDCFGIEALGRGEGLVKGNRIHGFVLNVFLILAALIFFQGFNIMRFQHWVVSPTAIAFFTFGLSCLLKVFQLVAFTVFYFHCKKHHGEEVELQGSIELEYAKISATPLVNDMP